MISEFIAIVAQFVPVLGTIALVIVGLAFFSWFLRRRWADDPGAQFRFQLIMLALSFAGIIGIVVALPVSDTLRGQLLSLFGILLSAAIALSSTTFIGNIMAGIMLKAVKSARPGDFITVAELTGRITEMGLLHTEVQTEFRDLVTVPNLYMVTQPMKVVRASGTIISAEVSLGYEVSHDRVSGLLRDATDRSGLKDGFVQVRELGDFSVTYRVAGLLENVQSLISARSALREAVLDVLHAAGIEIVSPNFMNTRAVAESMRFIPEPSGKPAARSEAQAEEIVFDKAAEAASVEELRKKVALIDAELALPENERIEGGGDTTEQLEARKQRLVDEIKLVESKKEDD